MDIVILKRKETPDQDECDGEERWKLVGSWAKKFTLTAVIEFMITGWQVVLYRRFIQ